jgi:hypothetical protein
MNLSGVESRVGWSQREERWRRMVARSMKTQYTVKAVPIRDYSTELACTHRSSWLHAVEGMQAARAIEH